MPSSLRRAAAAAVPFLLLGTLSSTPLSGQDAALLRWQLKKGDEFEYEVDQSVNMEMSAMGIDMKMAMKQVSNLHWSVSNPGDGGQADLETRFVRLQFMMDGGPQLGGKIEYDSKNGKAPGGLVGPMVAPILEALVSADAVFKVKMDGRGQVTDVALPANLKTALQNNPAAANMGDMFSEHGLQQWIKQVFVVLPEKSVLKGGRWESQQENKLQVGTMMLDKSYEHHGQEAKDARQLEKILMKIKTTVNPKPDLPVKIDMKSQNSEGLIYFDNVAGRMTSKAVKQKLVMEYQSPQGSMLQTLDQVTSVKLGAGASKESPGTSGTKPEKDE